VLNEKISPWINGPGFNAMLDQETSKGLKFEGHYENLQRVGIFGLKAGDFHGKNGSRTIVSIDAHDITGSFNPLGMIFRNWEVDDVHLQTGTVMLQKTEPIPGAPKNAPWPPWTAIVWPYRVQLQDVKVDDARILFHLKEKESGIYDTFLEITPNGHDFEYDARGGEFRSPLTPALKVRHAHLLIRRPRLYCSEFVLGDDDAHPEETIRLVGAAGLQDDRAMKLKIDLNAVNVSPWFPPGQRAHILGHASGHFDYESSGTGLETAQGKGSLTVADGLLHALKPVVQYIKITGSPDPGDLPLKTCRADVRWDMGAITLDQIDVESEGVFHLTGTITITADKSLSGQIELGLTDPYLKWLPTARTAIFTRDDGPYHFATVQLSGTAQKPQQDLSDRVSKEVSKSPLIALKLFFNSATNWFDLD
jgi:hypothetical protein